MMARTRVRACRSRQAFVWYTIWRFAVGLAVGTLIALAENADWLPTRLSRWIDFSSLSPLLCLSLVGPLLSQTIIAPLISIAGLYSMGYPYTSRILYTVFWMMRGMDMWNLLSAFSRNYWQPWLLLILSVAILCLIGAVMLRLHSVATTGVTSVLHRSAYGLKPTAYLFVSIRLWGALLILQAVFDLIYLSIL